MGDAKKPYNKGLKKLLKAVEELRIAEKAFRSSSANIDDFPTACHEVKDIAESIKNLNKELTEVYWSAHINRIR